MLRCRHGQHRIGTPTRRASASAAWPPRSPAAAAAPAGRLARAGGQGGRAAFRDQDYWGRPVPASATPPPACSSSASPPPPTAATRTGRVFTGDRSGDWLFASLHRTGFANQPTSVSRDDGLALTGCYITAPVKCAPPDSKPLPSERDACAPWLTAELDLLDIRVVVALGSFAWDQALRHLGPVRPKPRFTHAAEATLPGGRVLLGSYHVSQQNTNTGRLTEPMLDAVFWRARAARWVGHGLIHAHRTSSVSRCRAITSVIRDGDTCSGRMTAWRPAVQQGVQAAGLEDHVEPLGRQTGVGQDGDRRGAGAVELVVDALDGPLRQVDQHVAGEGQPDLALGAPLVVQRHQLGQELLRPAPGSAAGSRAATRAQAPVAHQLHREAGGSDWLAK